MTEEVVALGVAETVMGGALKDRLYAIDHKGMGKSTLELVDTSTHLGKEANSKVFKACICLSLMLSLIHI